MIRFFPLLFSILLGTTFAQKITDIVILKDGRSIKGEIVEKNLDGIVVVRLLDGSKVWFYEHEILKSEKLKTTALSPQEPISSKYNLLKPVPKSNLQPMESDLLVSTPGPRVVDAGHSILGGEFGMGFEPANKNDVVLNSMDFHLIYKVGLSPFAEWSLSLKQNVNNLYFGDFNFFDIVLETQFKFVLNRTRDDLFQISIQPAFGFGTFKGLLGKIGIPAEIHFNDRWKLNVFLNLLAASTDDLDSAVTNFPSINAAGGSDGNYGVKYKTIFYMEFSHSFLVRWIAMPTLNLFAEYLGYFDNVKAVLHKVPEIYSAKATAGLEFTLWKMVQLSVAAKFGFFDSSEKIGGALGMAVRF